MTKIYHAHLYGSREDKYQVLSENTINTTNFTELDPQTPFYLLIPQDTDLLAEYNQYFKITDIMPVNGVGMTTARDHIVIDFEKEPILERATFFRDSNDADEEVCDQLNIPLKKGWNLVNARKLIREENNLEQYIKPVLYRPFDYRFIFYHDSLVWRTVKKVMKNMLLGNNLGLITVRKSPPVSCFNYFLVTNNIIANGVIRSDNQSIDTLFPLYLYPDSNAQKELQEKQSNFSPDFLKQIKNNLGYLPTPEEIFYYIYAVFHAPTYRTRYAEFLKIDFPRVPITSNKKLFTNLSALGEQLVQLHLMTSPRLDKPITKFIKESDQIVATGHPKYNQGKVYINKTDYFQNVPEEVWNFYIGGYQVCQKWLKDRKGRTLSAEDITHYQKIIVALAETIKLMEKIDKTIPSFPIE